MFLVQVLTDQFGNRRSKIIKINIAVCSLRAGIYHIYLCPFPTNLECKKDKCTFIFRFVLTQMIFSTGQVVYCLCYSLFLNSNNDIFQKIMANFSEVSYLALNIFSAIKASQFNFSENLIFKKHCFAQSPSELLSYQVSRQQHYILDKFKKKTTVGHFCATYRCSYDTSDCVIMVFVMGGLMRKTSVVTGLQQSALLYYVGILRDSIRSEVMHGPSLLCRRTQRFHQERGNAAEFLYPESHDD